MSKVPKCQGCDHHSSAYGRIPYHICKNKHKPMTLSDMSKTSPKWCPLRVGGVSRDE